MKTRLILKRVIIVLSAFLCVEVGLFIYQINSGETAYARNLHLGNKYLLSEDYDSAISAFSKAIEIDAANADAYIGRGDAYKAKGDYESAWEDYEKAQELSGNENILREKIGTTEITVVSQNGEPIPEASIVLTGKDYSYRFTTDGNGSVSEVLFPDEYQMEIVKDEYDFFTMKLSAQDGGMVVNKIVIEKSRKKVVDAETSLPEIDEAVVPNDIMIVIDPGRGGDNTGIQMNNNGVLTAEKDINLKIGLFLKEELLNYENVNVLMTRDGDYNVELEERVRKAAEHGADMLISIHNDTHGDFEDYQDGCMILASTGLFRLELAREEHELAASVLRELSGLGLTDRGILLRETENGDVYDNGQDTDYYAIIRNGVKMNVPSILIEHSCMDNPGDFDRYLSSDDALRSLAKADAQGIANYYGLINKSTGSQCKIAGKWRENYTKVQPNINKYAASTFGEGTEWRPPISMNWTSKIPDEEFVVESEGLSYQNTVDYSYYSSYEAETARKMGMLLGLTEGHSDSYPDYYATGNQIEVGVSNQKLGHSRVHNDGNPVFAIHGIRIGMDVSECRKLLTEAYGYYSTGTDEDGTVYDYMTMAEVGGRSFYYDSDGKLKAWHEDLISHTAE